MNRSLRLTGLCGAALLASHAHASVTFFTSYAEWSASTNGAFDTLDFNVGSFQFLDEQYASLGVHFNGTSALALPSPMFIVDGWGIGSASVPAPIITVELDGPRNSFGVEYIGDARFQLFAGASMVFDSGNMYDFAALSGFGGVVLDQTFDTIKISGANFSTLEADNFYVGQAVPAPAAAAAFVMLLGFRPRRRQVCSTPVR